MPRIKSIGAYPDLTKGQFRITNFAGGVNMHSDEQLLDNSESPMACNVEIGSGTLKRAPALSLLKWVFPEATVYFPYQGMLGEINAMHTLRRVPTRLEDDMLVIATGNGVEIGRAHV